MFFRLPGRLNFKQHPPRWSRWQRGLGEVSLLGWMSAVCLLTVLVVYAGFAFLRPMNLDDICSVLDAREGWYEAVQKSHSRWGTPIPVMMAIMHQESKFVADARPGYKWFLGVIPYARQSTAFGYAQALDGVWGDYRSRTGNEQARRDNFADAVDFVGWYTRDTERLTGVSRNDAYGQYLAYHEGRSGYRRGSYNQKLWLLGVAAKVERRMVMYSEQYKRCSAI